MSRWWCLLGVACVLLAGCGDDEGTPSETAVLEVVVGADDRVLSVRLGGDGAGAAVSADESSEEVRLDGSSIEDCGDGGNCSGLIVPVHLDRPLGDRGLVDATTGDEVTAVIRCDASPPSIHVDTCAELAEG